jgi:signal transduction histidine kinase
MNLLRRLDTTSGRIFLILLLGMLAAATLGVALAEEMRWRDLRRMQIARAIERTSDFLAALQTATPEARRQAAQLTGRFVRPAQPDDGPGEPDEEMTGLMRERLPPGLSASVAELSKSRCDPPSDAEQGDSKAARAWRAAVADTNCLRIGARFPDGDAWDIVTGPPPLLLRRMGGLDPTFLGVLGVATAILAVLVAQLAAIPVRKLTRAAASLSPDMTAAPLAETGPSDVRVAIQAFNQMQQRIGRHATEQTHMIAAITHDLQTPMTRLRLKLEQMEDGEARERLLADWRVMRAIVEEGLQLARSATLREDIVQLDVDSLIESIVEDEVESGHVATFDAAAGLDLRCRPHMLRRCVQNLVDNAIKYGGEAHLSTHAEAAEFRIEIRDSGPGIPADQLETVFDPMVRLEASRSRETGGSGLGLTIARILAERNGAKLTLANRPEGGLLCTLRFERA